MSQRHLRNCLVGDDQLEVQRIAIDVAKTTKNKKLIPDLIDLLLHKDPTIQNASKDALIVIVAQILLPQLRCTRRSTRLSLKLSKTFSGRMRLVTPRGIEKTHVSLSKNGTSGVKKQAY